jgi:antitoxin MazE
LEVAVKVAKWGNSLAIRLPRAVVEVMGLKEGDDVKVNVTGSTDVEIAKTPDRLEMLARLRKYRGLMPADFKFDRDEANARD